MTSTEAATRMATASGSSASSRPQFGLLSLLAFVAACAVLAALLRLIEASPWLPEPPGDAEKLAATCFAALCFGGVLCGFLRSGSQQSWFAVAAFGTVALLLAQLFSWMACWHVYGEVAQASYCPVMCVVLVPPAFCAMGRFRSSMVASLLLAALTLPIWGAQMVLVARLNRLRTEILSIAEYAESAKRSSGEYPADLSGYRFGNPELEMWIQYVGPNDWWAPQSRPGDYLIAFDLYDGDNTAREYTPGKGWYFYPD